MRGLVAMLGDKCRLLIGIKRVLVAVVVVVVVLLVLLVVAASCPVQVNPNLPRSEQRCSSYDQEIRV